MAWTWFRRKRKGTIEAPAADPAPAAATRTEAAQPEASRTETARTETARTGAGVGLDQLRSTAPGLVSLYKKAAVSLEKHGIAGQKAAVYLVMDRSGSMRRFYRDGTMQRLAEQILALAANLDDDGTVPVVFFSTGLDGVREVSLGDHAGRIDQWHQEMGHLGRTNYTAAMNAVIEHYRGCGATDPAFVVFQTDGGPENRAKARDLLCRSAKLPIFWQFVGFGPDQIGFLASLDKLTAPDQRAVVNSGSFSVGDEPGAFDDAELYDRLTANLPRWLADLRQAGLLDG